MYKILIVDKERKIREILAEYVEAEGYEAVGAKGGADALKKCKEEDCDLALIGVETSDQEGYHLVKSLKKLKDIPVIVLSSNGEEYDILFGFSMGIDDYVVRPFSPKVVMARINAVLRRSIVNKSQPAMSKTEFSGIKIDYLGRNVFVDGKKVDLTPKEYDLLAFMIKNRGVALSRDKILKEVWRYDCYGDDRTVDTHVKMLRGNLGAYRNYVITLRGVGYKFQP